jgi:hypothetical protein
VWEHDEEASIWLGFVDYENADTEAMGWMYAAYRAPKPGAYGGTTGVLLDYYDTPEDAEYALRQFWESDV